MNKEMVESISQLVDYLDKIVQILKYDKEITREQDIAIQKMEEAVFWLSYGIENNEDKD